jgi:hypothetical protein
VRSGDSDYVGGGGETSDDRGDSGDKAVDGQREAGGGGGEGEDSRRIRRGEDLLEEVEI